ncbi:response regulator [Poritiphilus flavus]|uniref:Response regulator n=1 Tax=Poritiphilus flavus TaxID=2697053 RepID=A0A6L9EBY3_9FLAO|nr:response regulator transcription factor [Poritiphilus flavus]NAS12254.1 response regulator [Poritiphilus flavus]
MANKDVSIIIADDHPILLKGLYEELVSNDYNVIGRAADGMNALELLLKLRPDIAFLDIDMPFLSGFDVIKMARDKGVNTRFIVLSFHKEASYINRAKTLQISGYLLKEDSFFEIARCIEAVISGNTYFSSSFDHHSLDQANEELRSLQLLTPSELRILKLVARQISNNNIAEELGISVRTIEKHRSNIISKLNLKGGPNALTNWALTNKKIILEI